MSSNQRGEITSVTFPLVVVGVLALALDHVVVGVVALVLAAVVTYLWWKDGK